MNIDRRMNTLAEILRYYDDQNRKGFDFYDVSCDIKSLPKNELESMEAQAEVMAMTFAEGQESNDWGTYYGPILTGTSQEGSVVYVPDYRDISGDFLQYWEKRTKITKNPLMIMRYSGLVYDFKKKKSGEDPDYKEIKLKYIEAIVTVINGNYYKYSVSGVYYAERAFVCAYALHSSEMVAKVKDSLLTINERYRNELQSPGLWGRIFELVIKYREAVSKEELDNIVKENEERYEELLKKCREEGKNTDQYGHLLKEEVELLCDYYNTINNTDKIREKLDTLLDAINISADLRGPMWYHGMLMQMQALYRKYHLYKEANQLYVPIQKEGSDILESMQKFETSIPLDKASVDMYISEVLQGTPEEVFERFIYENIPNLSYEKQRQIEEEKQAPLLSMIPTVIYDSEGNPQVRFGYGEKDEEDNKLMYGMWRRMLVSAIFLRIQINAMEKEEIFTYETVMDALRDKPFIAQGHIDIIERGVKAYFDKDYLIACHLLIPQFESAIRMIVAMEGGDILRSSKNPADGDEYRSLEGLLGSEQLKSIFSEDTIVYFKDLFTAKAGANMRNSVCHGLYPIDFFNNTMADRIIHALMVLTK